MVVRKPIRTRGKLSLSKYFQILKKGDFVAIDKEASLQPRFPVRLQGITGIVEGKRGRAYLIKIKDGNKEKKLLI